LKCSTREGRALTRRDHGIGDRGWVSRIVVGLDVCVRERLVQAVDDGLKGQLWGGTSNSVGQDVSGGNLDGLLEKVVCEDNETGIQPRGIPKNELPVLQNLASCDGPRVDVEVYKGGVKSCVAELKP